MIRITAATVLATLLTIAMAQEVPPDQRELFQLYYDFEVASYCTLVNDGVGRGFRTRSAELADRARLSREALERLRGAAWQAAHAEWQNRGLGGFRSWCREDGSRAAQRIAGFAPRPQPR